MTLRPIQKIERLVAAANKRERKKWTPLQVLEADRADLKESVAGYKLSRVVGDLVDRDHANVELPPLIRKLKDCENAIKEARREQRDQALDARRDELQPDDDALSTLCDQLSWALDDFNTTYQKAADAAVALGVKVGASRHHPLSAANVDHAMRTWALGRLAVRFPGAADVPKDVQLPFSGACFRRIED